MNNINDSFFDGHYKDIWRAIIPEQLTVREVQFIIDYFNLQPGDEVLDMMCGYGRHAIELASRGISVTAIDSLADYINEVQNMASLKKLPLKALQQSVLHYYPQRSCKLIICMGNSLNFFNSNDIKILLNNLAQALQTGANLFINSWSLAETVIPNFAEKSEASYAGIQISSESSFKFYPTRVETKTQMTGSDGIVESRLAIDYIYSVNEIQSLLENASFELVDIYNIPGKKKFAVGDPRAYIIAKRK